MQTSTARRFCACECHRGGVSVGLPWCCPCNSKSLANKPLDISDLPISQAKMWEEHDRQINQLFRLYNDLSELRHATNQNEGCTRAKVENDIIPMLADLSAKFKELDETFVRIIIRVDTLEAQNEACSDAFACYDKLRKKIDERLAKLETNMASHIQNNPRSSKPEFAEVEELHDGYRYSCRKCNNDMFYVSFDVSQAIKILNCSTCKERMEF